MDFDGALQAHFDWKIKLGKYLSNPDGSLKSQDIEPDNLCPLGKWIQGEGAAFTANPDFAKLKSAHTQFHKAAAAIVRRADSQKNVSAEIALGAKSEYGLASSAVGAAIMAMKFKK